MIHNIVTDKEGNEHQAVEANGRGCSECSFGVESRCAIVFEGLADGKNDCLGSNRLDETNVIYRNKIKITDITRGG